MFMERLRRAKDQAEFDQFMADRNGGGFAGGAYAGGGSNGNGNGDGPNGKAGRALTPSGGLPPLLPSPPEARLETDRALILPGFLCRAGRALPGVQGRVRRPRPKWPLLRQAGGGPMFSPP